MSLEEVDGAPDYQVHKSSVRAVRYCELLAIDEAVISPLVVLYKPLRKAFEDGVLAKIEATLGF